MATDFDALGFDLLPFSDEGRLDEEQELELEGVVRDLLSKAQAEKGELEQRAKTWRKYISLDRYSILPWEGAPDVMTPLIRQKVDGIRAHIQSALKQSPMFLVESDDASVQRVSTDLERLMEMTIQMTESGTEIDRAIRDAVEVGTGHIKHVLVEDERGWKVPASRYVRFEELYVYPVVPVRDRDRNYFERYQESMATVRENVDRGIYWADKLKDELESLEGTDWNRLETLWEAWVWFRGELYEARYSEKFGLLSYRKSDWGKIIGRAPYDPLYIEPSQTSYWGDSIPQILEGLQEISDRAFQIELARGQFQMNPPIIINAASPAYQQLIRDGMWRPGEVVPGSSAPQDDVFIPLQQMNPFNVQLLQMAQQMSESASVPDVLIPGEALGGRKTATEINVVSSSGSQKLRNYLDSVASSLKKHARTKWVLTSYYILKNPKLAHSSRFSWIVNGRETVPEQQQRLQQLQYLLNPGFLQMVQLAANNPFLQAVLLSFLSYLDLPGLGAFFKRLTGGNGGLPGFGPQMPNAAPQGLGGPGGAP